MDTVEYFKMKARMVKHNEDSNCGIECESCPLSSYKNGKNCLCGQFETRYPEEAVAIVEKWAEEHPVKTRQSEFLEMFPNAPLMNCDGIDIIDIPPCFLDNTVITDECSCKKCVKCKKDYWLIGVEE